MKEFLNSLEEDVCLLDCNRVLKYLNTAALECLGYSTWEVDRELIEQSVDRCGTQTYLHIRNSKGKWQQGIIETYEVLLKEEKCLVGKIQWCHIPSKKKKAELLEAFLENLNQSVCIKDREGNYVYANRHYCERIHISEEEIFGTRDEDYWEEADSLLFKESDEYILTTNRECIIEEAVSREQKYYETTKFPMLATEKYIGILIKDISIQRILYDQLLGAQSEEERMLKLHETIMRLKEYLKTDCVNIWTYNEEREWMTPAFDLGKIKMGTTEQVIIPLLKEEARVVKSGGEKVIRANEIAVDINGDKLEFIKPISYIVYYPLVYEDKLVGVLDIVLDEAPREFIVKNYFMHSICQHIAIIMGTQNLSNRLQKESSHRSSLEADYGKLINIVTDIIIKVDQNGYIQKVNEGCKKVLGWNEEKFLNRRWSDLLHPEDYEEAKKTRDKWVANAEQEPCINRYYCSDGTYKWLRWDGAYINQEGVWIVTAKDITYQIELEKKEKVAKEVLQIEKLRSEFFANLSHEFKTPINIIMSALKMLEILRIDQVGDYAAGTKYIGVVKQNSYRLLRLVNNLIDATKLDAGYYDMNMKNYNIVYVIEDIVLSVAEYAKDQKIEIEFDTDTEEEIIMCDAEKIERIMLNLLSNAIKYTLGEGKIIVHIKVEEKEVLITVSDNGIGIPEEKVPYIFERFMQVNDVLTRHCEGSGVGLYLVKSLVELHKGQIEVKSKLREGTRFEVRLPRIQAEEEGVIGGIDDSLAYERRIEKCHIEFSDIYKI